MAKNVIIGQSGGPTSVINASLAGVSESCKNRGAEWYSCEMPMVFPAFSIFPAQKGVLSARGCAFFILS